MRRRLALLPFTLFGIMLVTFLLVHVAPGDPAAVRAGAGRGVSAESIAALRREYGLDQPLVRQFVAWLARSVQLDFGRSLVDGRPVRDKIVEALPTTLGLALLDQIRSTADDNARHALDRRFHALTHREQPYTFLAAPEVQTLEAPRVRGLRPSTDGFNFAEAWLAP